MAKILIVDDEPSITEVLNQLLRKNGHQVACASTGDAALGMLQDKPYDLLITDMRMPGMNGLELLEQARNEQEYLAVIVMTAYAEVDEAVTAMKNGAFDYITKPFKFEELILTVQRALSYENAMAENQLLKQGLKDKAHFDFMIGDSEPMLKIYSLINKVAKTSSTVLITGESGTGKELVARAIHEAGPRQSKPFVKINCAAMPHNLLESELFGYVKGAFTGANRDHTGLFETADTGTVFLDEIGNMPLETQVKLLRVLQEKEVRRVGGTKNIKVDVRVVAASNEDLEAKIRNGAFREDLFFRLSVIPIELPPLRERRDDIPGLVEHFLKNFEQENHCKVSISPAATSALCEYDWPGNIRQLENLISRLGTLNDSGEIVVGELPPEVAFGANAAAGNGIDVNDAGGSGIVPLKQYTAGIEREYIGRIIERFDGDKNFAAKKLGISLASLYRKYQD